jgi:hypothetical protein
VTLPSALLVIALAAAFMWWWLRRQRRAQESDQVRSIAQELIPEIRALLSSSEPTSLSEGEPSDARHYEACHQRLPSLLSGEAYFAVETFYQCVESYREARARGVEAFAEDDERSLGDRIRAKDRRDRCLKDVYYTGHAAIEKLETILA